METETITITLEKYMELQATWKPEHTICLIAVIIGAIAVIMLVLSYIKLSRQGE